MVSKEKIIKSLDDCFDYLWENTCKYTRNSNKRKELIKEGILDIIDGRRPTSRWKMYR